MQAKITSLEQDKHLQNLTIAAMEGMRDDPLPFINLLKDLLQRNEKLENRNLALEGDNNHYKGVIQSMNEARENWNRSGVPLLSPPGNLNLLPTVALADTGFN